MNDLGLSKREIERIEKEDYYIEEYYNDVLNYDNEFRMNTYSCENKGKLKNRKRLEREGYNWYRYCEDEDKLYGDKEMD